MQVWILPADGGEPQQLTDEPLGVESFRFAQDAAVLALFAPVLSDVEHDKQRETATERRKKQQARATSASSRCATGTTGCTRTTTWPTRT